MIILQARANLKKEDIEEQEQKIRKRVNLPGGIGRSWLRNFLKGFIIHRHG